MNVDDRHLSESEIVYLIGGNATGSAADEGGRTTERVQQHLDVCSECQDRVRSERDSLPWVRAVREETLGNTSSVCPPERELYEIAAGLLGGSSADAVVDHVARCATCAAQIRRILSELDPELRADEKAAIDNLDSSGQFWQSRFARTLASRAVAPPESRRISDEILRGDCTSGGYFQQWDCSR